MDDVISLIAFDCEEDDCLIQRKTETSRDVFCKVKSAARAEFFAAGQSGFQPKYLFEVFPADYEGETVLDYHGKRYSIYRTYLKSADVLELYAERKLGVQP